MTLRRPSIGKTYRAYPRSQYRRPKGRRQALAQQARPGAVPPDPWQDIRHNAECWQPATVAWRHLAYGRGIDTVTEMLHNRFRVPRQQMRELCTAITNRIRNGPSVFR